MRRNSLVRVLGSLGLAFALLAAASCDPGDGADGDGTDGVGADGDGTDGDGTDGDGSGTPDAGPSGNCTQPSTALTGDWAPVAKVSAGIVNDTPGGTHVTLVDATAGGFGMSANEPFVYISLTGGAATKIAIDDLTSFASNDWDLAIKRYVLRTNGGDSGGGGVAVTALATNDLGSVTAPPAAVAFTSDDWATDACVLTKDQLGAPLTAIGEWYQLVSQTLEPAPRVYVLRLRDGSHVKLKISSYYADPMNAMRSGYFRLEWAPL